MFVCLFVCLFAGWLVGFVRFVLFFLLISGSPHCYSPCWVCMHVCMLAIPVPSSEAEIRKELSGLKEVANTGPLCPVSSRTSLLELHTYIEEKEEEEGMRRGERGRRERERGRRGRGGGVGKFNFCGFTTKAKGFIWFIFDFCQMTKIYPTKISCVIPFVISTYVMSMIRSKISSAKGRKFIIAQDDYGDLRTWSECEGGDLITGCNY